MNVNTESQVVDGRRYWRLLIDGRPTPNERLYATLAEATLHAQYVVGDRPFPPFVWGYLRAALDTVDDALLGEGERFSLRARAIAIEDCATFREQNAIALAQTEWNDEMQHGADLWATRNGDSTAGFWNHDYTPEVAGQLTRAAQALGEQHVLADAESDKLELI